MSHNNRLSNNDGSSSSIDLKVFIKDVHDTHGRKRPLTVRPWASVKDVKDQLTKHLHIPASSQSIYFGPLLSSAKELPNHRTLQDAGIYRNGETLLLEIKGNSGPQGVPNSGATNNPSISSLRHQTNDICVSSSTLDLCPKSLQRLVQQSRRGLALGLKPSLAPDGSGGSYFLSDARKVRVGVFKPADEEPFADNNPRGYVPHDTAASPSGGGGCDAEYLRQGIRPGELCLREVAAFLLDHDGFAGVPMTTLAEARHPALHTAGAHWTLSEGGAGVGLHSLGSPLATASSKGQDPASPSQELMKKVGSFQEYVHAECTMDDLSPSKISVDEVHKIAILDIRLMNADRNVANILCQRIPEDPDHFRLVPIDHGYSLRSKADVAWFDWCWLDWPQLKKPLSRASREYVLGLDIEADARLLQERLNIQNDVLDYFRSSCQILKAGVQAGLTLYDICSEILCRNDPSGEIPSKLETLKSMASELAMSAVHNGRFHHATASSALEEQLGARALVSNQRACSVRLLQPSCKLPTPFKPRGMIRAASSSVFSQAPSFGGESAFTDELTKVDSAFSEAEFSFSMTSSNYNRSSQSSSQCPPGMVQSSQSSSDGDRGDDANSFASDSPEDCEAGQWAAALVAVADQSMDKDSAALLFGKNRDRSVSDSSESSSGSSSSDGSSSSNVLSKSPVGFWHVRPGSNSLIDNDSEEYDDDEPIWSLQSSSHHTNDVSIAASDSILFNAESNAFRRVSVGPPHILSPSGFSSSNLNKLLTESSPSGTMAVGFVPTATSLEDEVSHPSSNADDKFGPITPSMVQPPQSFSSFKPVKKMSRSISYSAFSTHTNKEPSTDSKANKLCQSTAMRPHLSSTHEHDLFRTYFMKFVDLLVVRETERLVHSKES
mmetsp:Transcript_15280/g.36658  ORF Transcript_15280/g.36658 Transcript_15280/m.36658 type:complete len:892 (-) Transcript_15280:166-2841(-)